jgi:thioredoxin
MIGEWLMSAQESFWLWTRKYKGQFLEWPTYILFSIINFIFLQVLNLFAQVRWPFSAVVRFIKSFHANPPGIPIPVNETELLSLINGSQVVLVDFWTEWCGPCILMEDSLKKLAKEYERKIVVAKVDATINPRLTKRYHVMGYPTIMLFFEGKEIGRVTGAQNHKSLVEFINHYLAEK